MSETQDLKVFITAGESTCGECGDALGRHAWITLVGERGALCLACADLDHLVFLPSGDAALTRRARKHSALAAVVLKWSRARKRYERQGLLVEEGALASAEAECLADADDANGRASAKRRAGSRWTTSTSIGSRSACASSFRDARPASSMRSPAMHA